MDSKQLIADARVAVDRLTKAGAADGLPVAITFAAYKALVEHAERAGGMPKPEPPAKP